MAARFFAFVVWAALAASVVFWSLRLADGARAVPSHAVAVGDRTVAHGDLSRLFGREAAPGGVPVASAGSAIKLLGVVAPQAGSGVRAGVALISIEGKPARPFRVGAAVGSELVLLAVHQRGASLGPREGETTLALELAPPAAPATGRPAVSAAGQDSAVNAAPGMRLPAPIEAAPATQAVPAPAAESQDSAPKRTDPGERPPQ